MASRGEAIRTLTELQRHPLKTNFGKKFFLGKSGGEETDTNKQIKRAVNLFLKLMAVKSGDNLKLFVTFFNLCIEPHWVREKKKILLHIDPFPFYIHSTCIIPFRLHRRIMEFKIPSITKSGHQTSHLLVLSRLNYHGTLNVTSCLAESVSPHANIHVFLILMAMFQTASGHA